MPVFFFSFSFLLVMIKQNSQAKTKHSLIFIVHGFIDFKCIILCFILSKRLENNVKYVILMI